MNTEATVRTPELGSISCGTLLPEDLIPIFADTLDALVPSPCRDEDMTALLAECDVEDLSTIAPVDQTYLLDDLIAALDSIAPPFTYFGTHPGDGADFGFWIDHDYISETDASELLQVNDLADIPPDFIGYVLHTTDHGMTLYSHLGPLYDDLHEIWSCV